MEQQRKQTPQVELVGLILNEKGVLRHDQTVYVDGKEAGKITSGSFSPTLEKSIAFARISRDHGNTCTVEIRGKQLPATIVKPPFIKKR